MINKLGFGFLRLPKQGEELDWEIIPTYNQIALSASKASDCIGCRSCEKHCPQKLTIALHMKTIARSFE